MQPYTHPQQPPDGGHRGPLSRSWPQIFKKRRRYSPVRESAQQQQAQQPQIQQHDNNVPIHAQQPLPPMQQVQQAQLPIHAVPHAKSPSITTQSMTTPGSSIRSPSITADTASTISSISHASSAPPNKIPISRRSSSIVPVGSNGAGGVTTPQADLLASKSNYELISSGEHLEMGLHFSTAMATGVMMKRATHRAAEQARRDRMKTAMVDLAEFLLDGEVTFGSGTTCFVVMRGGEKRDANDHVLDGSGGANGTSAAAGAGAKEREKEKSTQGEKRTVNKARLIEMALEKMKAQEREIEMLRKEVVGLRVESDCMDVT